VAPEKILHLIQSQPEQYSLAPDFKLTIRLEREDDYQLLRATKKQLQHFY
jgi:hypothetical protein